MRPSLLFALTAILFASPALADQGPSAGASPGVRKFAVPVEGWRDPETTGSVETEELLPDVVPGLVASSPCRTRTWLMPSGREVRVHAC